MLAATFQPAPAPLRNGMFGQIGEDHELSGVFGSLAWLVGAVVVTGLLVVGGVVVYRGAGGRGLGMAETRRRTPWWKHSQWHTEVLTWHNRWEPIYQSATKKQAEQDAAEWRGFHPDQQVRVVPGPGHRTRRDS